jgi:hypothetical protein
MVCAGMRRAIVTGLIAVFSLAVLFALNRSLLDPTDPNLAVPDVTGLRLAKANAELWESQLLAGALEARRDSARTGTVLEQGVAAGSRAIPTTPVTLIVSAGPDPVADDRGMVVVGDACDVQAPPVDTTGDTACVGRPLYALLAKETPAPA